MASPVVMYGHGSWTIKKAEHQRIDAFRMWCWRRLLRIPWTTRRSNQSILKEISLEYSLEGLMLKLKLQYFGHLMQRVNSLENTLMMGKTRGEKTNCVRELEEDLDSCPWTQQCRYSQGKWKLLSRVQPSDSMDYTVHGILQARILEWAAFPSPGDLPDPGIEPRFPALKADSLPAETQVKPRHP